MRKAIRNNASSVAQRWREEGAWKTRTYAELEYRAHEIATVLRDRGVRSGDRVALRARTRADWTAVEIAALMLGTPLVPLYPTMTREQLIPILKQTAPTILITEPGTDNAEDSYNISHGILTLGEDDGDLGDLAGSAMADNSAIEWHPIGADHLFTVAYSSGSTGEPKGCVILQRQYAAVLDMVTAAERNPESGFAHRASAFIYLPLAHASARLQQLTSLAVGGEIVYGSGGSAQILAQIGESSPTYIAGVPRLFEMAVQLRDQDPHRLRALFGQNFMYGLSGGAPLSAEVQAMYEAAGVLIVDGYGLTESSTAIAIGVPHAWKPGTVGKPLPGLETRIADDGEILVRGANVFSGYLGQGELTAVTVRDGWLHTGDLGSLDEEGFLRVTGRKKNLIVTSTGKNISPERFENLFRAESGTGDFVLVGEGKPYLIGLAAPSTERELNLVAVLDTVMNINAQYSPQEQAKKIVLLDRPLTQEQGEITASGKVVRDAVVRNFQTRIAEAYEGINDDNIIDLDRAPSHHPTIGVPTLFPEHEGVSHS